MDKAAHPKENIDELSFKQAVITVPDQVGALAKVLDLFTARGYNLKRIESLSSRVEKDSYDMFVDFDLSGHTEEEFQQLLKDLQPITKAVSILSKAPSTPRGNTKSRVSEMIWFPRKIVDLDGFAEKTLEFGEELDADHPGFHDKEYRERRADITRTAKQYRHGQEIPRIEYTEQEKETWGIVYRKLRGLYATHACSQFNHIFPLLEQNCGYSDKDIPQLEDISKFLKDCTGWRLRPVMGLLSSRDFLNGLAFRVFHSTQYIRHHSRPFYTPEPDVCHELLGHVPMFADPAFADFSQEIGLASLGASDADIEKLATVSFFLSAHLSLSASLCPYLYSPNSLFFFLGRVVISSFLMLMFSFVFQHSFHKTKCYWFTVEFGICRQKGELKAYGAGLLSSFGELEYCLTDKPKLLDFNPFETCNTKYPITEYQPLYYVADSFERAKNQMRMFAQSLDRPFTIRYNPYTESVEVVDTMDKLLHIATNLQNEASLLVSAMSQLSS
ncbi:phenylalanine 4-monooxygenase, variant 3 [Balamuthia mandrillaris]